MQTLPTATVFSRADARACGWSDSALGGAIQSGRVVRLRRDQFTCVDLRDDPRAAAIAAVRSCSGSVISHRSAALMHGLPLLQPPPVRSDLTVQPRRTGDVRGALLHRASLRERDVVEIDGVPVTAAARTLVDLARTVSLAAAVVTTDAALHNAMVDQEALDDVMRMCRRWPRIRKARPVLALADARSESPLESFSRLVIWKLRPPAPDLQAVICHREGWVIGRADFYWDEFGVVGEADGRSKYDDRDVLTAEKTRQEDLENPGVVVVRWGWIDAKNPHVLIRRLENAFERGRRRDASGFPRQWSVRAA
jgi:hypothetical protein